MVHELYLFDISYVPNELSVLLFINMFGRHEIIRKRDVDTISVNITILDVIAVGRYISW